MVQSKGKTEAPTNAANLRRRFVGWQIALVSILLAVITMLGSFPSAAQAQSTIPGVFYLITSNNTSKDTSIWQVDTTSNNARRILTLTSTSIVAPSAIFPEHEHAALDAAVGQGSFLTGTADTPGITQAIEGAWLLDINHLLIKTDNEVCDRVAGGCYGFYEFLLVDITTGNLTSFLKVSYHNSIVRYWSGCTPGSSVYIDSILPNPSQDKFVFTLKPTSTCYPYPEKSYGFIVDYSTFPVTTTEIPSADGVSWSPDGAHLAYYTREACQDTTCTTSVNTLSMSPGSTPVLLHRSSLYHTTSLFTAWIDNRTVMYQWRPNASSESPFTLSWHDIVDNGVVTSSIPQEFLTNSVYYFGGDEPHLLGLAYPDGAVLGIAPEKAFTVETGFPPTRRVFYNSRFSSYLFADLRGGNAFIIDVFIIDSNLNQLRLDLSIFISADMGEDIFFAVPG